MAVVEARLHSLSNGSSFGQSRRAMVLFDQTYTGSSLHPFDRISGLHQGVPMALKYPHSRRGYLRAVVCTRLYRADFNREFKLASASLNGRLRACPRLPHPQALPRSAVCL